MKKENNIKTKEKRKENSLLNLFGLTYEQSQVLFSIQRLITNNDISIEKNQKSKAIKLRWLKAWEIGISDYFNNNYKKSTFNFLSQDEVVAYLADDLNNNNNHSWINIITLECITFVPYTPLEVEFAKELKKAKFDVKHGFNYINTLLSENEIISNEKVIALKNTYKHSFSKISGKKGFLFDTMIILLVAATSALLAAFFAAPIAVALFGKMFAGLKGIALINACLAMAGGGAIAVGGGGMAAGFAVIVGGGAILGVTGGSAAVGVKKLLIASPDFALSQSAKVETILKEIILAENQDVLTAQQIIAQYRKQILELKNELANMELNFKKNENDIKNIKKTIKYMNNAFDEMQKTYNSNYNEQ